MKKDIYVYPAIFDCAADGISIEFPDLPGCLPCAKTTVEAVRNAKEAAALHLYGMEEDGDPIPEPTPLENLSLEPNQIPILIEIFMPQYRDAIDNSYVRKNVTIPRWLEKAAIDKGINFSLVLQSALKERVTENRGLSDSPVVRKVIYTDGCYKVEKIHFDGMTRYQLFELRHVDTEGPRVVKEFSASSESAAKDIARKFAQEYSLTLY